MNNKELIYDVLSNRLYSQELYEGMLCIIADAIKYDDEAESDDLPYDERLKKIKQYMRVIEADLKSIINDNKEIIGMIDNKMVEKQDNNDI